jgi:hypothetical protein
MIKSGLKQGFLSAIGEQKVLFEKLGAVMSSQNPEFVAGKSGPAFEKTVRVQEEYLSGIRSLEIEKQKIFGAMIKEAGLPDGVKFSDLTGKLDKKEAAELETPMAGLLMAIKKLDVINVKNIMIMKNFMGYVDFVRKAREKLENPENTIYTSDGLKKVNRSARTGFDSKI